MKQVKLFFKDGKTLEIPDDETKDILSVRGIRYERGFVVIEFKRDAELAFNSGEIAQVAYGVEE